ncbi:MAG TPA: hypothetical protein VGO76_15850 [Luteibacter sp.]|nr:hypothetical protein [Luteibacter sp.]
MQTAIGKSRPQRTREQGSLPQEQVAATLWEMFRGATISAAQASDLLGELGIDVI